MDQLEIGHLISESDRKLLVDGFKDGYQTPLEHFNEFVGHTNKTFGFELHHTIKYSIAEKSERSDSMEVLKQNPGFLLKIGKLTVSFYRVGRSFKDSIQNSFPLNKSAGSRAEKSEQLSFDLGKDFSEQDEKHVLAHIGNSEEGLLGLYLCEIKSVTNGKITEWKSVYPIWQMSENEQEQVLKNTSVVQNEAEVEIQDETFLTKRKEDKIGKSE